MLLSLHFLLTSPFHSVSAIIASLLFFKMPSTLSPQILALPFLLPGMCFFRYMFGSLLITRVSAHMSSSQRDLPWPSSKITASTPSPALCFPAWFFTGHLTHCIVCSPIPIPGSHLEARAFVFFTAVSSVPRTVPATRRPVNCSLLSEWSCLPKGEGQREALWSRLVPHHQTVRPFPRASSACCLPLC